MSKVDNMENELILGFRKLEGINLEHFFDKFEENLQNIFPIKPLIKSGDLIYKDGYVYINPKKLYVMNEILLKLIWERIIFLFLFKLTLGGVYAKKVNNIKWGIIDKI